MLIVLNSLEKDTILSVDDDGKSVLIVSDWPSSMVEMSIIYSNWVDINTGEIIEELNLSCVANELALGEFSWTKPVRFERYHYFQLRSA